jgi:ABC-type transporter Mla subunit MlaD
MAKKEPSSRGRSPWWSEPAPAPEQPPDEQSPETTTSPPGGSRAPDVFERREPFLDALGARLSPLEDITRRITDELNGVRGELRSFAEDTHRSLSDLGKALSELRDRGDEHASTLWERVAQGLAQVDQTVRREGKSLAEDITTATRKAVASAEERLRARADEADEAASERIDGTRRAMEAGFEQTRSGTQESIQEMRGAALGRMEETAQATQARLGELETTVVGKLSSVGAALDEASAALRTAVSEARQALESAVASAADRLQAEHARTTDRLRADQVKGNERLSERLSKSIGELEAGFARISRLADNIETLGQKRAFQELVRSEEALREEQADFVERLREAGAAVAEQAGTLSQRIARLEERLATAGEDLEALERLPAEASAQVAAAVDHMRADFEEVLGRRFAGEVSGSVERIRSELEAGVPVNELLGRLQELVRSQSDVSKAQREVEKLSASVGSEAKHLRQAIEGWGKPRTAPQLAEELQALEGRVSIIEGEIAGLVEAVAARVTESVLQALQARKRRGLRR